MNSLALDTSGSATFVQTSKEFTRPMTAFRRSQFHWGATAVGRRKGCISSTAVLTSEEFNGGRPVAAAWSEHGHLPFGERPSGTG